MVVAVHEMSRIGLNRGSEGPLVIQDCLSQILICGTITLISCKMQVLRWGLRVCIFHSSQVMLMHLVHEPHLYSKGLSKLFCEEEVNTCY